MPNLRSRNREHQPKEEGVRYVAESAAIPNKSLRVLNMQRVKPYDNTEGEVAVIPKSTLKGIFKKQYTRGFQRGLLSTAGAIAFTTFPILTAETKFKSFLGIEETTWPAIYFLLFLGSLVAFIILLIINFSHWWRGDHTVEEIFSEHKKLT